MTRGVRRTRIGSVELCEEQHEAEDDVLVEAVLDEARQPVVAQRAVDHQQPHQEPAEDASRTGSAPNDVCWHVSGFYRTGPEAFEGAFVLCGRWCQTSAPMTSWQLT